MGIITKGMGAIMKSKMRKAFVDKPTFPGPNVTNILNREIKKKIKIQQEAVQRFKDMNKVVDMEGSPIDTSKGIMGGKQADKFIYHYLISVFLIFYYICR